MEAATDDPPMLTPRARASRSAQVGQERPGASSGNGAPHSGQCCGSGGNLGLWSNSHRLQRKTEGKVAHWFTVRLWMAPPGMPCLAGLADVDRRYELITVIKYRI